MEEQNDMNITEKNFDQIISEKDKLLVLDFWAAWCGPCRMLAPVLQTVEEEYPDVVFGKINVDEEEGLARRFGIVSIPTLVFMKNGVEVQKSVGYMDADALRARIENAL